MLLAILWLAVPADTAKAQWGWYGGYGYEPYSYGYHGRSPYYRDYYAGYWYDPGGYGYQPSYGGYGYGPGYFPGFQAGYGYGQNFTARDFGYGPGAVLDMLR
jgi:hypothetical protein